MNWRTIRLELDRTPDYPVGSASRAIQLLLPLNERGEIDEAAFRATPGRALFRRHWGSDPDQCGQICRRGRNMAMRAEGHGDCLLELDGVPVRVGQQVPMIDDNGSKLPLKVVSVR